MESERQSELWKALQNQIDGDADSTLIEAPSNGVPYSFQDRIAGLFLSGFLPIVFFQIVLLWLAAPPKIGLVFWGGLLLSPLWAAILRPLCASRIGSHPLKLVGLFLALVFSLPLTQFVPTCLVDMLKQETWMPNEWDYLLARAAQDQLEGSLEGYHWLWTFLGVVILVMAFQWIKKRFPWVDFREPSAWSKLPGLALCLLPWCIVLWLLKPNTQFSAWQQEVQPAYEQTLISGLVEPSTDFVWGQLELDGDEIDLFKVWEEEPSPDVLERLWALEQKFLVALETQKPSGRRELRDAWLLARGLSYKSRFLKEPVKVWLSQLEPTFFAIRQNVNTSTLVKWLEDGARTEAELQRATELIKGSLSLWPSSLQDLDLRVYDQVFGAGTPPSLPIFHGVTPKGGFGGIRARVFRREDLKIGNGEIWLSPMNLLLEQRRAVFLDAWLESRGAFVDGLDQQEVRSFRLTESWNPEMGAVRSFQDRVFAKYNNDLAKAYLESSLVYIKYRLLSMRSSIAVELSPEDKDAGWHFLSEDGHRQLAIRNSQIRWVFP